MLMACKTKKYYFPNDSLIDSQRMAVEVEGKLKQSSAEDVVNSSFTVNRSGTKL